MAKHTYFSLALVFLALALLAGCHKDKPQQAGQTQLPPGVTGAQAQPGSSGMTSLPQGVDEADPAAVEAAGQGIIGENVSKAVLDSRGRLGGPYPNSTLAVFSPMLYATAVERLGDVKLLQELLDNGSAVFVPNGSEVDYIYETQHDQGYVAIMYQGKRWYVAAEDATLKGASAAPAPSAAEPAPPVAR